MWLMERAIALWRVHASSVNWKYCIAADLADEGHLESSSSFPFTIGKQSVYIFPSAVLLSSCVFLGLPFDVSP